MSNAGSPDVKTRTVGTRLIYFTSVLAHFTIFPLRDFLDILRRLQRLQSFIFLYKLLANVLEIGNICKPPVPTYTSYTLQRERRTKELIKERNK